MVKDIALSKKFYEDLFGFKEKIWYGEDLLFLQNSHGFDLALSPIDTPLALPPGFHYGFSVKEKTRLQEIYSQGKELYPKCFKTPPKDHGSWGALVCCDIDNYPFEIYWDENLHSAN